MTTLPATTACTASINLNGEHFPCDWPTDETGHHDGWGHANKRARAVWTGDDTETTTAAIQLKSTDKPVED
jgi:hypothetical protein